MSLYETDDDCHKEKGLKELGERYRGTKAQRHRGVEEWNRGAEVQRKKAISSHRSAISYQKKIGAKAL